MHIVADSLNDPPRYFEWGWLSVSLPNLIMILIMVALFVLALVVPFPRGRTSAEDRPAVSAPPPVADAPEPTTWTGHVRVFTEKRLPYDKLMPEKQPAYVASWIYVFGVATLAALGVIIASGSVLAFRGPAWYHVSSAGLFVNSIHFWSVQLFFLCMVVHLWGKFWMAAWRGRRAMTWITGLLAFTVSTMAGLTGYLLQDNFDSQWIAFESKDGLNAVGIGAWFNVADLGQMLLMHAFLLPAVLGLFVVVHVIYVRLRGVVPPIDAAETEPEAVAALTSQKGES